MNRVETIKLLALIKVAYPTAYRDQDEDSQWATVNMWEMSFRDVPYQLMEQAFNSFRMVSKFPPTVAEIAEQLRLLHYKLSQRGDLQRQLGDPEGAKKFYAIADCISQYKDWPRMESIDLCINSLLNGGERYGTSGNRLDRTDGLPFLDAGMGRTGNR